MGEQLARLLLALLLLVAPGSSAVTGPGAVKGWERGSLTVQCRYGRGYETYVKWWCRGAAWISCNILVRTTGSEQEVRTDRVSIRDHQNDHVFTVTMEALTRGDADTYWCGVERAGVDLGAQVKVTVDPATTVSTTTTTTTTATTPTTTSTTTPTSTAPVTTEEDKASPTRTNSKDFITKILPLVAAVLLLVLTGASLLAWRLVRRQSKDAQAVAPARSTTEPWEGPWSSPRRSGKRLLCEAGASGISPEQASESELCYASLALHQTGTAGREAFAHVEVEMEYTAGCAAAWAPPAVATPKEDVTYEALSLGTLCEEPTYSNMEQLVTHIPSRSQEKPEEYSTVRRL